MKKPYLFLITAITLLLAISLTSATLCKTSDGYYEDCSDKPLFNYGYQGPSDKSSASYYNYNNYNSGSSGNSRNSYSNSYDSYNTNSYNSNNIPVFKGSYGNYRYQMYANGDYTPNKLFVDYPDYGYPVYFGGGYNYSYPYSRTYSNYYGGYPFSGYYNYQYGYGYDDYGYNNRYSVYPYDSIYYSTPFFYG